MVAVFIYCLKRDEKRTPRAERKFCDWEKAPVGLSIAERRIPHIYNNVL